MARPQKQTVDYFPHQCTHGKTMYILEQKYGNDGYAFWFKLLELLGTTEGHYLKLENPVDWEFLTAKTRLSGETCEEILNLLVKLEAIDAEAWEQRMVWCEKFIENVKDAYRNRTVDLPKKPDCLRKKQGKKRKKPANEMKEDDMKKYSVFTSEIVKIYPGKKIKAVRDKKLPGIIAEHGEEQVKRCVKRYAADVKGKAADYILLESTFWNGRYMDYLDENYQEQKHESGLGEL